MRFLITNDDGYTSSAFIALVKELRKDNEIVCVAPQKERSWIGKGYTINAPVIVEDHTYEEIRILTCSGTPADCIQLGIHHFSKSKQFDAIIAGLNLGRNDGLGRLLSSGTVASAFEGALAGVPAFAFSITSTRSLKKMHDWHSTSTIPFFENHSRLAAEILKKTLKKWNGYDLLCVNFPLHVNSSTKIQIAHPSKNYYGSVFNHQGKSFVFSSPQSMTGTDKNSDEACLHNGEISLVPLSFPKADNANIASLKRIFKLLPKRQHQVLPQGDE